MTSEDIQKQLDILEEKRNALASLNERKVSESNALLKSLQSSSARLKSTSEVDTANVQKLKRNSSRA
ncbi:MAG: hypothetical protein EKK63_10940 [Acinetobacter sp.]|uniref:hypothetical protein n=1 Tax=Acinetobacter sp. TaxID=472 RepID=UPI000F9944CC|nr:hypothetical protein [Acinetobacter sp.]RUP38882.1 MAG: hypothetical protein EKK63_10940 [Acinetobacter sp.]